MYIGPDGALYLIDYYRNTIEHPEWMAADTYHAGYLYNGQDRGRIYRIVPDSKSPLAFAKDIRLGQGSDAELVQKLASPNIWWRRTAQRLLVERHRTDAVPLLVRLFQESTSPLGREHALWTLDRKSTRLNSSHGYISYAVFCLKKKKKNSPTTLPSLVPSCI